MSLNYQRWQKLFLYGLGVFVGTAFCMKWLESEFVLNGDKFTIIGLEISYTREEVAAILGEIDGHLESIVKYQLYFDFAFMAGVYPAIASLCMMAREKTGQRLLRRLLFSFAALQTIAWGCDIFENLFLLRWIDHPVIGTEFQAYHIVVIAKWILAILPVLFSIPVILRKKRTSG